MEPKDGGGGLQIPQINKTFEPAAFLLYFSCDKTSLRHFRHVSLQAEVLYCLVATRE